MNPGILKGVSKFFSGPAILAFGLCSVRLASAGAPYPEYVPQGELSGELHSVGADTMDTVTLGWLEIIRKSHPLIEATMEARSAATAITGLISGQGQLGPNTRMIYPNEAAAFTRKFGYAPTVVRVTLGTYDTSGFSPPLAIVVHKDNPIGKLTLAEIGEIYAKDGAIATWGQLGLAGEWADKPLSVWGLREPNGIAYFFREAAMNGRAFRGGITLRPADTNISRSAQRTPTGGVRALEDIVKGVGADRYAIAYVGLCDIRPGVRVVPIAARDGGPPCSPTHATVESLQYPLVRFTYIFINRAPGKPVDPNVREFLRVVLSRQGQDVVKRSVFLPLPPEVVQEELAKLD